MNLATLEYREHALDVVQHGTATAELLGAEAESHAREQRLAAERALDAVLADSFPASDPPSWTLGVRHSAQDIGATSETDTAATVENGQE
jgi:hypothetical protein